MRNVRTISVSLEPEYVRLLERLAKRLGTKSDAVRDLLARYVRSEAEKAMEREYRDYYADASATERDRDLTAEMLRIASWPEPGRGKGKPHGGRRRTTG